MLGLRLRYINVVCLPSIATQRHIGYHNNEMQLLNYNAYCNKHFC